MAQLRFSPPIERGNWHKTYHKTKRVGIPPASASGAATENTPASTYGYPNRMSSPPPVEATSYISEMRDSADQLRYRDCGVIPLKDIDPVAIAYSHAVADGTEHSPLPWSAMTAADIFAACGTQTTTQPPARRATGARWG
jgi:hypothetical protein